MKEFLNKKIDENLQIDTELSTLYKNKTSKRIKEERKLAKRLGVSYQKYLDIKKGKIKLW